MCGLCTSKTQRLKSKLQPLLHPFNFQGPPLSFSAFEGTADSSSWSKPESNLGSTWLDNSQSVDLQQLGWHQQIAPQRGQERYQLRTPQAAPQRKSIDDHDMSESEVKLQQMNNLLLNRPAKRLVQPPVFNPVFTRAQAPLQAVGDAPPAHPYYHPLNSSGTQLALPLFTSKVCAAHKVSGLAVRGTFVAPKATLLPRTLWVLS